MNKFLFLTFVVVCTIASCTAGGAFLNPSVPEANLDGESRIVDGKAAHDGQFPHMCYLTNRKSSGLYTICGGSLISTTHVLTAAHCVVDVETSTAGFGTVDRKLPYLRITTQKFTIHPEYDPSNLVNNIAIWRSPIGIIFNSYVNPIRLPTLAQASLSFEDAVGTLSGFGRNNTQATTYSQILRYVNLKVISNKKCAEFYGSHVITSSALCAVGVGITHQGSCDGDGGSPLIMEEGNERTQIALAAFTHSKGCETDNPNGFVRVGSFLSWINKETGVAVRRF